MRPSRSETAGGYTRLQATAVGPGAAELLRDTASQLAASDSGRLVGKIVSTFDRTVYVSLPVSTGFDAPPLVAIGTSGLRDGPLLIYTDTPVDFSFQELLCGEGDECIVSVRGAGEQTGLYITLGDTVLIDVRATILSTLPVQGGRYERFPVETFGPETDRVATHQELVTWLAATGIEDGLGTIERLASQHRGDPAPQLNELIDAWITALTSSGEECSVPEPIVALLGRGPGATPSGDDTIIGLLLVCLAIEDRRTNRRVRTLADGVLAVATDRTTEISRALLAQAACRRAASPAIECLQRLVDADATTTQLRAAATTLVETGHRSGADTLAGMLVATTTVLPELAVRKSRET